MAQDTYYIVYRVSVPQGRAGAFLFYPSRSLALRFRTHSRACRVAPCVATAAGAAPPLLA